MSNFFKRNKETEIENTEALSLASGESYIIFNNLKNSIIVWINCDKEMQIRLSLEEFKKVFYSIFPNLKLSEILFYLNRGDYVFTDKFSLRPLRPQDIEYETPVPTLQDTIKLLNAQKRKTVSGRNSFFTSPFTL